MSKKVLELTQDNAIKAYNEGDERDKQLLVKLYGKEVFNQTITDRVKTFADVVAIAKSNHDIYKHLLPADTILDDYIKFPTNRIELLAAVLNEGWKPNWKNGSERKYFPWFDFENGFSFRDCVSYYSYSRVGSRLCFKSRELAEYAGKQFLQLYKDSYVIE